MTLDLSNYEDKAKAAVRAFWLTRSQAVKKQKKGNRKDQGERSAVTSGKNMDGFVEMAIDVVRANGLKDARIMRQRNLLTLPGYFRPTKLWDLLVFNKNRLIAVLEFKSQVGPSFGNNANNRCEEALGSSADFLNAFREGALGDNPMPFLGYLILVEDTDSSRSPVKIHSKHFEVFPEFIGSSYADRYKIMCEKLIRERFYTSATVLLSPRSAESSGEYVEMSELTSLKTFITSLAGHIAAEAAR